MSKCRGENKLNITSDVNSFNEQLSNKYTVFSSNTEKKRHKFKTENLLRNYNNDERK